MRILSVGSFNGESNTCVHRTWALEKLGHVDKVNMYEQAIPLSFRIANRLFNYGIPVRLPDFSDTNKQMRSLVKRNQYDVVWIDKGWMVNKETLEFIKKHNPKAKIISYSPDNMALRHNQSQNYLDSLPFYDFVFTNKSYILNDLKQLGAKNVHFVNNSYEDSFHYPREISEIDLKRLGADVGFVGAWEKERAESIIFLALNGIKVRVFGDKVWQKYKGLYPNLMIEDDGLFDEDYAKSFKTFKISLCFLRKMNFDQQTTRTMEIPACGGFMLAERTDEHLALFEEGKEAAYFASNEELLEKCRYYLNNEQERIQIASNGHLRCQTSGYDNAATIKKLINMALGNV